MTYKWKGSIVVVLALEDQQVLMIRRVPGDSDTDWQWVSETYETSDGGMRTCACRGLQEELGLEVNPNELVFLRAKEADTLIGFYLYPVASSKGLALNLDPDEVGDTKWVSLEEARAYEEENHQKDNAELTILIESYLQRQ